ncbi:NAD(+) synthase [Patescibacteria group bacterium]|nr:NAD(+) synthase [Patescibacteria group bacterium]
MKEASRQRAVVGLSGGVDSSLTLKIAIDALGPSKVTAIILPELGISSQENIDHAKKLAEFLKVETFYQPLNTFLIDFSTIRWNPNELAQMNTKARIRMTIIYNYANTKNAIVLGTSNLSESMIGYGTKYGDLAADVEVLGSLYKTEVYELAEFAGLPPEIIHKAPSAELKIGQTDEEEIGGSYRDIDNILMKMESGLTLDEIIDRGLDPNLVRKISRMRIESEHKRKLPPVLAVDK